MIQKLKNLWLQHLNKKSLKLAKIDEDAKWFKKFAEEYGEEWKKLDSQKIN